MKLFNMDFDIEGEAVEGLPEDVKRDCAEAMQAFSRCEEDEDKTFLTLRALADKGNKFCCLAAASLKFYGGAKDYKTAYRYLKKADNCDDVMQFGLLGIMYYAGNYVKQNRQTAFQFFIKAIKSAEERKTHLFGEISHRLLAEVKHLLGKMYFLGEGVKKDAKKAVEYLASAADNGVAMADILLGLLYYRGDGVAKDIRKAIKYLKRSYSRGNAEAGYALGMIYFEGDEVPEDEEKGIEYFRDAAKRDSAPAQCMMGILYHNGVGIEQDFEKAFLYLKLAAAQNSSKAQFVLAGMYWKGVYVDKDPEEALSYLTLAVNQGSSEACFALGVIYYHGYNVGQDKKKGLNLITNAAISGCQEAAQYLMELDGDDGGDEEVNIDFDALMNLCFRSEESDVRDEDGKADKDGE